MFGLTFAGCPAASRTHNSVRLKNCFAVVVVWVCVMPGTIRLSTLHQRTVAVQFALSGRQQTVIGRGVYERDPELGNHLRIDCPEDVGCDFVIQESSYSGLIQPGDGVRYDFLIRLD
jgi:hypothetical protein